MLSSSRSPFVVATVAVGFASVRDARSFPAMAGFQVSRHGVNSNTCHIAKLFHLALAERSSHPSALNVMPKRRPAIRANAAAFQQLALPLLRQLDALRDWVLDALGRCGVQGLILPETPPQRSGLPRTDVDCCGQ